MSGKHDINGIVTPHEHDVLSGRGNFVNYHAGNEHFRALVRKHKVAYVACPKPQKGKFSRLIVDEIKARNPPGRFLKQDPNTKLWHDIGEKKALDKTRQALREGAPEISKELTGEEGDEDNIQNSVLQNPTSGVGLYGLNDALRMVGGGYGGQDIKNEFEEPLQVAQHAAISNMMQQQRLQQPQQQQFPRQAMGGEAQQQGALLAGIQRMQQQQQQQQQQKLQQQQRLQQQSLSRHLSGVQLGAQLGGQLGGLGGLVGMGGGIGGIGVNPYANFQNDYDEFEPTPLDPGMGNSRYPYGQNPSTQSHLQSQLQVQAQLQVQSQQLQQLQQRQQTQHEQQQAQLRNQAQSLASPAGLSGSGNGNNGLNQTTTFSSLKGLNKMQRPEFDRENSELSLQFGNAFEDTVEHGLLDSGAGGVDKNKQRMGNSSNHMSFMSLTVSELGGGDDVGATGDLSSMFDSSLQISDKRASNASAAPSLNVLDNTRRRSTDESKAALLDMSVATLGDGTSTHGGFGSALGPGGEIEDSQAHMSFSNMFDDSEKQV